MRKIFLGLLALSILVSSLQISLRAIQYCQQKSNFLGDQFKELAPLFGHVRKAGYYTDKNLDETVAIAQFEQAQYILAPTILDLNNADHSLVIFDFTTPVAALQKINELGLKPLKVNNLGIILAVNPKAQELTP